MPILPLGAISERSALLWFGWRAIRGLPNTGPPARLVSATAAVVPAIPGKSI